MRLYYCCWPVVTNWKHADGQLSMDNLELSKDSMDNREMRALPKCHPIVPSWNLFQRSCRFPPTFPLSLSPLHRFQPRRKLLNM